MIRHSRVRTPGFGRCLGLSVLLHVCAVVGLTLLWKPQVGLPLAQPNAPLRVSIIYPAMEGMAAIEAFVEGSRRLPPHDRPPAPPQTPDEAWAPELAGNAEQVSTADGEQDGRAVPQAPVISTTPPPPDGTIKRPQPAPSSVSRAPRKPSTSTPSSAPSQDQPMGKQRA